MPTRDTILLGDSKSASARNLRRLLYFAEPNSGRRTLRDVTGHQGGCGHAERPNLIPIYELKKSLSNDVVEAESTRFMTLIASTQRIRTTMKHYKTWGRGSSIQVVSHFDFARSLRSRNQSENGTTVIIPVEVADWRAVSGFGDEDVAPAKLRDQTRPKSPFPFDSEEDRKRVGFVDKGLRRFHGCVPSPVLIQPGNERARYSNAQHRRPATAPWKRAVAGGPSGPKELVDWRNWKDEQVALGGALGGLSSRLGMSMRPTCDTERTVAAIEVEGQSTKDEPSRDRDSAHFDTSEGGPTTPLQTRSAPPNQEKGQTREERYERRRLARFGGLTR
jgi:hypothetical protein